MKFTTVSVSYSRKFNLGDYESLELGCSLWAQVEGKLPTTILLLAIDGGN